MTHPRTLTAVASAAVLAFALTGCGDSSEESDSTALTAEEFRTQADKICSDGEEKMDDLEPPADASAQERDQAFRKLGDLLADQVEQIGDLTPPEDIADEVDAMLVSLEEAAEAIKEQGAAAFQVSPGPLDAAIEKADALGLKDCGE